MAVLLVGVADRVCQIGILLHLPFDSVRRDALADIASSTVDHTLTTGVLTKPINMVIHFVGVEFLVQSKKTTDNTTTNAQYFGLLALVFLLEKRFLEPYKVLMVIFLHIKKKLIYVGVLTT
jgi:hypothetical protein